MSTIHINARPGDFTNVVIISGDPLRTKWIAENYLHDFKLVNTVRGALAYTGYTKNNIKISLMSSGIGIPSMGLYSYELFNFFNVDYLIRVGTCGAYQANIKLFDIILVEESITNSNWANQYKLRKSYRPRASKDLFDEAVNILNERKIKYHSGKILCSDVFYNLDKDNWKKYAKKGVLGVEMESYSLYSNAINLNKHALCMLTVSDHLLNKKIATIEERVSGLSKMVESAIQIAEKFANK